MFTVAVSVLEYHLKQVHECMYGKHPCLVAIHWFDVFGFLVNLKWSQGFCHLEVYDAFLMHGNCLTISIYLKFESN